MFKEEEGWTAKFLDRLLMFPQHTMSIINGYVCHSIHQTPAPRQISSRPLLCLSSETELTTRNIQRITTIQSTSDRNTVRSFGINQHLVRTHHEEPHFFILLHCPQHSQDSHKPIDRTSLSMLSFGKQYFGKKNQVAALSPIVDSKNLRRSC